LKSEMWHAEVLGVLVLLTGQRSLRGGAVQCSTASRQFPDLDGQPAIAHCSTEFGVRLQGEHEDCLQILCESSVFKSQETETRTWRDFPMQIFNATPIPSTLSSDPRWLSKRTMPITTCFLHLPECLPFPEP